MAGSDRLVPAGAVGPRLVHRDGEGTGGAPRAGAGARPAGGDPQRRRRAGLDGRRGQADAAPRRLPGLSRLAAERSEEHTSELQSLMRNSYAVFFLKKKIT